MYYKGETIWLTFRYLYHLLLKYDHVNTHVCNVIEYRYWNELCIEIYNSGSRHNQSGHNCMIL